MIIFTPPASPPFGHPRTRRKEMPSCFLPQDVSSVRVHPPPFLPFLTSQALQQKNSPIGTRRGRICLPFVTRPPPKALLILISRSSPVFEMKGTHHPLKVVPRALVALGLARVLSFIVLLQGAETDLTGPFSQGLVLKSSRRIRLTEAILFWFTPSPAARHPAAMVLQCSQVSFRLTRGTTRLPDDCP